MDLENVSKSLQMSNMGAQNVTAILMSFINQIGREGSRRKHHSGITVNQEVEDDTEELTYNLTTILLRSFENNTAFLHTLTKSLNNEEQRWKDEANRRVSDFSSSVLIIIYVMVIAIGTFGNLLLILAVARQKTLRTARNAFVINLAVSDLLLCLVTVPLTLVEILNGHWPLGDSVVSCKAAGGLQAVSVFVSTISITVIAIDRYQLIVCQTRDLLKRIGAAAGVLFIWALGFLLAAPIFAVREIEHHEFNSPRRAPYIQKSVGGVHSVDFCYEKWPFPYGRATYSALTLLVQYTLPVVTISVLHSKIGQRLRIRHVALESMAFQDSLKRIRERKRLRRRHHLLIAIALVFSITWLPLNVINLILDVYNPFIRPEDEEKMTIIYATCHLIGMSSACANPFLYGWFNSNFRSEFICIFMTPFRLIFGNDNECFCCSLHMFGTETSSFNVVRSVVPSPENNGVRQRPENHQNHQSTIDLVEGSDNSVVCALGQPTEPKLENVFISDEARMVVQFSKTTALIGHAQEVVINPVYSINDPKKADVTKKRSSVSLEKPIRHPLLETHL